MNGKKKRLRSESKELTIDCAVYGGWEVTGIVKQAIRFETLRCEASPEFFGHTMPQEQNHLLILFKFEDSPYRVAFCSEGECMTIRADNQETHYELETLADGSLIFAASNKMVCSAAMYKEFKNEVQCNLLLKKMCSILVKNSDGVKRPAPFDLIHVQKNGSIKMLHWDCSYTHRWELQLTPIVPVILKLLYQGQDVTDKAKPYMRNPSIFHYMNATAFDLLPKARPPNFNELICLYHYPGQAIQCYGMTDNFFSPLLLPLINHEIIPVRSSSTTKVFQVLGDEKKTHSKMLGLSNRKFADYASGHGICWVIRITPAGEACWGYWEQEQGSTALRKLLRELNPEWESSSLTEILKKDHPDAENRWERNETAISHFLKNHTTTNIQYDLTAWVQENTADTPFRYFSFLVYSILRHRKEAAPSLLNTILMAMHGSSIQYDHYTNTKELIRGLIFAGFISDALLQETHPLGFELDSLLSECLDPKVILNFIFLFPEKEKALQRAFLIAYYQSNHVLAEKIKTLMEDSTRWEGLAPLSVIDEGLIFKEHIMARAYGNRISQKEFRLFRRELTGLLSALLHEQGSAWSLRQSFDIAIKLRQYMAYLAYPTANQRDFYAKEQCLFTPITNHLIYEKYLDLATQRGTYDPATQTGGIFYRDHNLITYKSRENGQMRWVHADAREGAQDTAFMMAEEFFQVLFHISSLPATAQKEAAFLILLAGMQWSMSFACPNLGGNAFATEVLAQTVAKLFHKQISWDNELPDCHAYTARLSHYVKIYAEITLVSAITSAPYLAHTLSPQILSEIAHAWLTRINFETTPITDASAAASTLFYCLEQAQPTFANARITIA